MRILFVIASLDVGGAEKMFSNIMMHLPKEYEVDLLLNSDKNIAFPYRGNKISLHMKEPPDRRNLIYQIKVFIKRYAKLRRLKKKRKYDVVVSAMDSANVANILTGNQYGKVIITVLNNISASRKRWYNRLIVIPCMKLFYNKADKIVVLSEEVRKDIVAHYRIRQELTEVIYCSIDQSSLEQTMRRGLAFDEKKLFQKDQTVVTAGRLDMQKGQWHLIRAFYKVKQECKDARLVIFGKGMLEDCYRRLIREYGLEDAVTLYGVTNELPKYIYNSAVFAFPSVYEGFGTALQEALACNTACVCTDYQSGGREIMDAGNKKIRKMVKARYGMIVPRAGSEIAGAGKPLDEAENCLADAIILLLKDKELRNYYADKARERAEIYDIHSIIEQWKAVFEA